MIRGAYLYVLLVSRERGWGRIGSELPSSYPSTPARTETTEYPSLLSDTAVSKGKTKRRKSRSLGK